MKKSILLSIAVLLSIASFAFEVPSYYLKPVKNLVYAPFVKAKPLFNPPITVNFLRYQTPCNGTVEASVYWGPTPLANDATLYTQINWRNGSVNFTTVNYTTAPAGITGIGLYFFTTAPNCSATIVSYSIGWYYL